MSDVCQDAEAPTAPDCATALRQALAVYHQLMVGSSRVVKVKTADTEVEYERSQAPQLLSYITRLNAVCPCPEAGAIIGIGRRGVLQPVYGPDTGYNVPNGRRGCC